MMAGGDEESNEDNNKAYHAPYVNPDTAPANSRHLYPASPVFPTLAFLGMALVLVFILNHIYRTKGRHRKHRRPRIKRLPATARMSGV